MKILNGLSVIAFILICVYLARLLEPKVCINSTIVQQLVTPTGEEILSCTVYLQNPFLYKVTEEKLALKNFINSMRELDYYQQQIAAIKNKIKVVLTGGDEYQVSGSGLVIIPSIFLDNIEAAKEIILLEWIEQVKPKVSQFNKSLFSKLLLRDQNQKNLKKVKLYSLEGYCQGSIDQITKTNICDNKIMDKDKFKWVYLDLINESLNFFLNRLNWKEKRQILKDFLNHEAEFTMYIKTPIMKQEWVKEFKWTLKSYLNGHWHEGAFTELFKKLNLFAESSNFKLMFKKGILETKNIKIKGNSPIIEGENLIKVGLNGLSFSETKSTAENLVYVKCSDVKISEALSLNILQTLIVITNCESENFSLNVNISTIEEFSKKNPQLKYKVIDIKSLKLAQKVIPQDKNETIDFALLKKWLKWEKSKYSVITKSFSPQGTIDVVRLYRN